MFLYSDIVQAPKHKYIVVSVDDSDPENIQYGLIRDTKDNRDSVLYPINNLRIVPEYWYCAGALKYVESLGLATSS
jgi:hypothetical protein